MKIDRENQDLLWDQTLDRMFVTFFVHQMGVLNGVMQHTSMSKRRLFATSENQPPSQSRRRNDSTEASTPVSVPQLSASLVVLHSDIVRLSRISSFPLPIHSSYRSFRSGQGISECKPPPACRLWYLCWGFGRCVCLLLQGR